MKLSILFDAIMILTIASVAWGDYNPQWLEERPGQWYRNGEEVAAPLFSVQEGDILQWHQDVPAIGLMEHGFTSVGFNLKATRQLQFAGRQLYPAQTPIQFALDANRDYLAVRAPMPKQLAADARDPDNPWALLGFELEVIASEVEWPVTLTIDGAGHAYDMVFDADMDSDVDGRDLLWMQRAGVEGSRWQSSYGSFPQAQITGVPEPCGSALVAAGIISSLASIRKRS